MNIWTQMLSLNGHLLGDELPRLPTPPVSARATQSPAQIDRRDQETQAARRAIPLWRPAPWIAIR